MTEISLLTWNINQWPAALSGRRNRRRLGVVRRFVRDFDIVCLQEAWSTAAQELRWEHRHHYLDDGRSALGFGSGLLTLSRFPVVSGRFIRYNASAIPDSMASKGIALAALRVPGQGVVNVINTHLQARFWPGVRKRQMRELDRFVEQRCSDATTLLAGDLNARRDSDEFRLLHDALRFRDAIEEKPPTHIPADGPGHPKRFSGTSDRIDHLLMLPRGDTSMEVLDTGIIEEEIPGEITASDHRGLFVKIRLGR